MSDITAEERAKATVTEWFHKQWPSSSNLDPHVDCAYKKLTKCIAVALHAHAEAAHTLADEQRFSDAKFYTAVIEKAWAEEREAIKEKLCDTCKQAV